VVEGPPPSVTASPNETGKVIRRHSTGSSRPFNTNSHPSCLAIRRGARPPTHLNVPLDALRSTSRVSCFCCRSQKRRNAREGHETTDPRKASLPRRVRPSVLPESPSCNRRERSRPPSGMAGRTKPAEDPPARSGHASLDVRIASNRCAHRVARPGVTLHLVRWIATVHVFDLRRVVGTADLFGSSVSGLRASWTFGLCFAASCPVARQGCPSGCWSRPAVSISP
jgi:hypothetical protein